MNRLHAHAPRFTDTDPPDGSCLTLDEHRLRLIEAEQDFFALLWQVYTVEELDDFRDWLHEVHAATAMVQYWRAHVGAAECNAMRL